MTRKMTGTLKRQVDFREAFNQDAVGLPSLLSGSRESFCTIGARKCDYRIRGAIIRPSIRISLDFVASQDRMLFRGVLAHFGSRDGRVNPTI